MPDDRQLLLDIITREVGTGVLGRNVAVDYRFRLLKLRRELRLHSWNWAGSSISWLSDMTAVQLLEVLQDVQKIKRENSIARSCIDKVLGRV